MKPEVKSIQSLIKTFQWSMTQSILVEDLQEACRCQAIIEGLEMALTIVDPLTQNGVVG